MKDLATNVWQDLREKGLWPVALLLAVALVAVPVLLLKGMPEQPPPPVAATDSDAAAPLVASDETAIAGSSKLGSFDPKDPFRSMADRPRAAASAAAGVTSATVPDVGGALGGDLGLETGAGSPAAGGALDGGDPGSSGGGSPSASGGGSSPASGSSPSGSGSTPGGSGSGGSGSSGSDPKPSPSEPAKPRYYTFAADLSFGLRGDERELRGLEAVAPLVGRRRNVVAVYLGQTPDNESVFLVNQSFKVTKRRSNCRSSCAFVHLRPERGRNEVILTGTDEAGNDRGAEYRLILRDVRRVVDERKASSQSKSAAAKRRARAADARSRSRKARRTHFDFRVPMIAGQRR